MDELIDLGKVKVMSETERDQMVAQQIARNEIAAAAAYAQQGFNPAKKIYTIAVKRGYVAAKAEEADTATAEESPEAKKIREKAEQSAGTQTLGAGGTELTRETIVDGSMEEFSAALAGRGWKKTV